MLKYFFQNAVSALKAGEKPVLADNRRLFSDLKIMEAGAEYTARLGAYPVISLTLKDFKHARWEDCYGALKSVISKLYESNYFLTAGDLLSEPEKKRFTKYAPGPLKNLNLSHQSKIYPIIYIVIMKKRS